jgi:hypothetical protein
MILAVGRKERLEKDYGVIFREDGVEACEILAI